MRKFLSIIFTLISFSILSQITTVASGNWSNPSIWSTSTVPGSNNDVIINHTVTITSAVTIKTVTINSRLINNGNTLNIRGDLSNNGTYVDNFGTIRFRTSNSHNVIGNISTTDLIIDNVSTVNLNSNFIVKNITNINGTLNSNGFLILYADVNGSAKLGSMSGVINGNFTSQIWINRCNKWSYYSDPFNTTFDAMNDSASNMIYTGFPGSDYPTFSFINTYKYITNSGYIAPSSVSDNLNRGVGYCYWNSDTVFQSSFPSIPQQWKISSNGSINFNSSFPYALSYSPSDAWNLVGNPYPGTIDWRSNNWTKSNISSTIYMWNTCNQNWATYNSTNNASTNGANRYISPYQGFFVLTSNNSAALSAPKSVIVDNSATLLKPSNTLPPYSLMISTGRDEVILSMDSLATDYYDQDYDGLLPDTSNYLYSLKNNEKYLVNVIEFKNNDTIDLSVKNSGTLTFTGISSFTYHNVYLLDTQNSNLTQLNDGYAYPFSVSGINENRYKVVFQQSLFSGVKTETLSHSKKLVKMVDILGRDVTDLDYKGLVIYVYDDGSTNKKIIQ